MKKKAVTPIKTCGDCIHEFACRCWNDGRLLSPENAARCPANETAKESASYLIGKMDGIKAAQPKWISVEERLPDTFVSVLVHMPDEAIWCPTVHEGYRTPDGGWYSAHFVRQFDEVTHWMPLPEPPKEEP